MHRRLDPARAGPTHDRGTASPLRRAWGHAFPTLAAIASLAAVSPALRADVVIGGTRPTTVRVPSGYDPDVPAPLMFVLHGCPSDGPAVESIVKFGPLAEELGILYALPSGSGALGSRSWGACSGSFVENSAYLRGLIEEARTVLNVDPNRVFFIGYSDGGFMAYRMACDHPDLVAAIACLASANFTNCRPTTPVPVLDVHGTSDQNVSFSWGSQSLEAWANAFWEMGPIEIGPGPELVGGVATSITRWSGECIPVGPAELWRLPGVAHFPALLMDGETTRFSRNVADWLLAHPRRDLPMADVIVSPSSGVLPLDVTADASASVSPVDTSIVSHCWWFDSASESGGPTAQHTYEVPGRHVVRVAVVTEDQRSSLKAEASVLATCPEGDLGTWTATLVGDVEYPGSARFSGDVEASDLLLCAAGDGVRSRNDRLLFVYQELEGDFRLTARVAELQADSSGSGALLLCRESLIDDSAVAAVQIALLSGGRGQYSFRYRLAQGESARANSGDTVPTATGWLRLERQGDLFRGLSSEDGETWNVIRERTLDGAPTSMLVGLAATRAQTSIATSYEATRVRVSEIRLDLASQLPGDCNQDGSLDISDGICLLGNLFLGDPSSLPCGDGTYEDRGNVGLLDSNGDQIVDLSDAVSVLGFLYLGGPPPVRGVECIPIAGCPGSPGCP